MKAPFTPHDALVAVKNLVEGRNQELELPEEEANKVLNSVSGLAHEAYGRFDRLRKFFIAGVTVANAAGLSAALGAIRGDLTTDSPLVVSAVLFAAGLTVALVNPLLTLARDWLQHRRIFREYSKLLNRETDHKPLKVLDVLTILRHLFDGWYSAARFVITALSILLFVGGLWWPIIGVAKRLLH
jgi:hypothetical protein